MSSAIKPRAPGDVASWPTRPRPFVSLAPTPRTRHRTAALALVALMAVTVAFTTVAFVPAVLAQPPDPGHIHGRVLVAGRTDHSGVTLLLDGSQAAVTGQDGLFDIADVTPGKHLIRATMPRYLCAEVSVMAEPNHTAELPDLDLAGGDTDGNGQVDLFDLVLVGANYGLQPPEDPRSDLNDDGATNLLDLVMVGAAYDLACPQPWTILPAPSPTPGPTPTPSPTPEPGGAGGRVVVLDAAEIVLADGAADPRVIYARTGAEITWRNTGDATRTLVADDDAFRLDVPGGGQATWQVPAPGIYPYHDAEEPALEGVVVVPDQPGDAGGYYRGLTIADYYRDSCGGCHGPARAGGLGPALVPERLTGGDASYVAAIRDGRPNSAMPAWRQLGLTEAEIWGLLGYLRSPVEGGEATWDETAIRASLTILMDDESLPDRPRHGAPLDNLMLVTERENRSVAVLDGDSHRLVGHVESGYRTHGYAFPPTSDRWVYTVGRDGWVYKLDMYGLRAVRMIRVGLDARSVAVSDDGRFLIVGNYVPAGAVILDADTLEPLRILTAEYQDADGQTRRARVCMANDVAPDLAGPYFLLALKEAGEVWRVDWSQPDFLVTKLAGVGQDLHDGFLSPDNRTLYLAAAGSDWMAVVDVPTMTLLTTIPTGDVPHPGPGAVWTAAGHAYGATVHAGEGLVTVWDMASHQIVGRVETPGSGLFIRSADNSPYVWADAMLATEPHAITVFRKEPPFEVVRILTDGQLTLHPELTADGRFAYVSDWTANLVRVYDATTLEQVAEIGGIMTPTGIFNTVRRAERMGN